MFDRSVNKVVLVGNLGKDPEMRWMQNGNAVAGLTLATSESWKDKQSGERVEKTEWHRLGVFNRLGEMCGEFLRKGAKIYIEGKLQTRKWQDSQGNDRYTTEIVVNELQLLDGGPNAPQSNQQNNPNQQQHQQGAPAPQYQNQQPAQQHNQQPAPQNNNHQQQQRNQQPAPQNNHQQRPPQHQPQQQNRWGNDSQR